jgi:subtilisin family serine protease
MIGASTANDAGYTGSGVKVAVVDSGIEQFHPEFSGITIGGQSYVSGKSNIDDVNGHGTHVAGIIAARRDGQGMRGVAYGITSLPSYRIGADNGSISLTDTVWNNSIDQQVVDSVDFSNNSWGHSTIEIDEIDSTWISNNLSKTADAFQTAVSNDVIFVWAAGNNQDAQPSYQAGLPDVVDDIESGWIAVMALDNDKKRNFIYTTLWRCCCMVCCSTWRRG